MDYQKVHQNQSLFNNIVVKKYLDSLKTDNLLPPPQILIELFFNQTNTNKNTIFGPLAKNKRSKNLYLWKK